MNIIRKSAIIVLAASALILTPLVQARMTDRAKATIVGAAVGGVLGGTVGNNMESTLLGAAVGGTAGNLYAKRNQKREAVKRENKRRVVFRDRHHHHYYDDNDGRSKKYGQKHKRYHY